MSAPVSSEASKISGLDVVCVGDWLTGNSVLVPTLSVFFSSSRPFLTFTPPSPMLLLPTSITGFGLFSFGDISFEATEAEMKTSKTWFYKLPAARLIKFEFLKNKKNLANFSKFRKNYIYKF